MRFGFPILLVGAVGLVPACSTAQIFVPQVTATSGPNDSAESPPLIPSLDTNQAAQLIIAGINNARTQQSLSRLTTDPQLELIANSRSEDMIARGYFSHYDPKTGDEMVLRDLQAAHFSFRFAGENIAEIKNAIGLVPPLFAVGSRYTASELANEFVQGWLNSREHRDNIMNPRFQKSGVGVAVGPDRLRIVGTQVFSD